MVDDDGATVAEFFAKAREAGHDSLNVMKDPEALAALGCVHDDPFFDTTDGAHPAWWRGCDHGFKKGLEMWQRALDGLDNESACPQVKDLTVRTTRKATQMQSRLDSDDVEDDELVLAENPRYVNRTSLEQLCARMAREIRQRRRGRDEVRAGTVVRLREILNGNRKVCDLADPEMDSLLQRLQNIAGWCDVALSKVSLPDATRSALRAAIDIVLAEGAGYHGSFYDVEFIVDALESLLNERLPEGQKHKLIIGEKVVSPPGAGVKITKLELSPEARVGLSTGGVKIARVASDPPTLTPEKIAELAEESARLVREFDERTRGMEGGRDRARVNWRGIARFLGVTEDEARSLPLEGAIKKIITEE